MLLTRLENVLTPCQNNLFFFVTNTTVQCADVSPKVFGFVYHLWPCTCRTSCMRPDLQLRWSQCCGRWTVMALLSPSTPPLLSDWPPPIDRAASPSSRPRPPPSPWWPLTLGLPQTQRWFQTIIRSRHNVYTSSVQELVELFEVKFIFNN